MLPGGQAGKFAGVGRVNHDLHAGRIYTKTTMTAAAGDRTWLLSGGQEKWAGPLFRLSNPPSRFLATPYPTSSA